MYEKYMVDARNLCDSQYTQKVIETSPIINVCIYGAGRSPGASERLDRLGYPSVFLDRGLIGLENTSPEFNHVVIKNLKLFPFLFLFASDLEQDIYSRAIKNLNVPLKNIFYNEIEFANLVKKRKVALPSLNEKSR
jgi:hypothetical protein